MTNEVATFVEEKLAHPATGSAFGFHIVQGWNENKYHWFLQNILGYRPLKGKRPLIFGGVWHDSLEFIYKNAYDVPNGLEVCRALIDARRKEYELPEHADEDAERMPKMLLTWGNKWAIHDQETYNIIEVEEEHWVTLRNGAKFSFRADILVEDRENGAWYPMDHKTTGYSKDKMIQSVELQDQCTAYLLGLKRVYPEHADRIVGLIPDVAYNRGNVFDAVRGPAIIREKRRLITYEMELVGLIDDMAEKVAKFRSGNYPPWYLFPHNGKDDSYFGCDYSDICHSVLPEDPNVAPPEYYIDESVRNGDLEAAIAQWASAIAGKETTE